MSANDNYIFWTSKDFFTGSVNEMMIEAMFLENVNMFHYI